MRSLSAAIGNSWGYSEKGAANLKQIQQRLIGLLQENDGGASRTGGSADVKANRRAAAAAIRGLAK